MRQCAINVNALLLLSGLISLTCFHTALAASPLDNTDFSFNPNLTITPITAKATLSRAGFSAGSLGSISTMAEAQAHEFNQAIARRQNALHSFSQDIGSSGVFFGDQPNAKPSAKDKLMDYIGSQLDFGPAGGEGGAMPDIWTSNFKRKGKVDAADSLNSYDYDLNGFAGGVDMKLDEGLHLGFSGGYSRTSSGFDALGQTSTAVDAYHSAIYGSFEKGASTFDSMVSFTYLQNHSLRSLTEDASGNSDLNAKAQSKGYELAWSFSAMQHRQWKTATITPLAGFTFASLHTGGFRENGADFLNVSSESAHYYSLRPMLGMDVAKSYSLEPGKGNTVTPEIYAIYHHECLDAREYANARLNALGQLDVSSPSTTLSRHSMQLGGIVALKTTEHFNARLQMDADLQPSSVNTTGLFTLNYSW